MNAREKIAGFMTSPFTIISVISLSFSISIFTGNIGTMLGFAVVFFTLWAIKWDWSFFGIRRNPFFNTLLKSLLFTFLIIVVNDVVFQPAVELLFGETDLSALDGIRGNVINYLIFLEKERIITNWAQGHIFSFI